MNECNMFDVLEQVIEDKFRLTNPGSQLKLSEEQNEKDPKGKGLEVTFRNTGKCFAFSLDVPGEDPFPIFKPSPGIKQKNDAIIYFEKNQRKYCFIVELKSNKYVGAFPQLKCGRDFMDYLFTILEKNFKVSVKDVEFKYIIFTTNPPGGARKTYSSKREKVPVQNRKGIDFAITACNSTYSFDNFI
ncbi:hypothetical protein [Bacillus cereus]|uniref:hypothetical protein n=1 Tax=Bacillus cereus TaxID=1396 RepID=UPI000B49CEAD|nr:hypothetical protein [Bacillus cereus]